MMDTLLEMLGLVRLSLYEDLLNDYLWSMVDMELRIELLEEEVDAHTKEQQD